MPVARCGERIRDRALLDQRDIMPQFGETLSAAQVNALVKYLKEVAGK